MECKVLIIQEASIIPEISLLISHHMSQDKDKA